MTNDGVASRRFPWLASVSAAVVVGLLNTFLTISLAALVFSGDLSLFLAQGTGLALISAVLAGVVIGLSSSIRGMVGSAQDAVAAVLAVAAAGAVAVVPADAAPSEVLTTILVANGVTALVVGGFLLVLGAFRLGRLVRFLPFPVIGGFLAGMGWLIVTGSIGVMTDMPVGLSTLPDLFRADTLLHWVPAVAYAVVLLVVSERYRNVLTWPALLLVPIALFYGVMAVSGGSIEQWRSLGALPGAFPEGSLLSIVDYGQLGSVHWPAVWSYAPSIVALCFIVAISVLFNTTALELITNADADLDAELRAAGVANLAVGAVGGQIGYQMLGDSALLRRIGRGTRVESLGSVAVVAVGLVLGARFIPLLPSFLIGAFLAYIGVLFLRDWLVDTFRTVTRIEYAIVVLIVVVIAAVGFLEGVGVGILATVVMFVVDYGRADVVKHELSGRTASSRVTRSRAEREILDARGQATYVLVLQGFVFFGTASGLIDRVQRRLVAQPETRFVILDFQGVPGLDATARLAFEKMARLAQRHDARLILSRASEEVTRKLEAVRTLPELAGAVRTSATLDKALEWCEDRLLSGVPADATPTGLHAFLAAELPDADAVATILEAFEPVAFAAGESLVRQGDPPDVLYYVADGRVTALLDRADGPRIRFETMGGGSLVGELGFYTGAERSASVVADEPTRAYRLTRDDVERMTSEAPAVAAAFHALVVRVLAKRTGRLMRVVEALQG